MVGELVKEGLSQARGGGGGAQDHLLLVRDIACPIVEFGVDGQPDRTNTGSNVVHGGSEFVPYIPGEMLDIIRHARVYDQLWRPGTSHDRQQAYPDHTPPHRATLPIPGLAGRRAGALIKGLQEKGHLPGSDP